MAKTKILFLSSTAPMTNQLPSTALPSIETFKAIEQVIKLSKQRNQFEIIPEYNLSAGSIQEALMHYTPRIVHFFGHGEKGCLYFQNEDGSLEETKIEPFVNMFRIINDYQRKSGGDIIRLVILVACNSDRIAKAVSEHVDCAIGISNEMPVNAGIAFSEEFYAHLCEGRDVQFSFNLASNVTKLLNLNEKEKPKIFPEGADFTALTFGLTPKGTVSESAATKQSNLISNINPKNTFPTIKTIPNGLDNEQTSHGNLYKSKSQHEDAVNYSQQGFALLMSGKIEESIRCFDKALKINPNLAETWDAKATALFQLGALSNNIGIIEESSKCFDEALQINPQYADAWYGKGMCLNFLGLNNRDVNAFYESIKYFDTSLQISPQNAATWSGKGVAFYNLSCAIHNVNALTESIKCFNQALQINPQLTAVWQQKTVAENTLQVFRTTGLL